MRPTSPPAQNARPAPVTTTTWTLSSPWASPSARTHASIIGPVKALSLSGRFSVMVATRSFTSYRRSVIVNPSARQRWTVVGPGRGASRTSPSEEPTGAYALVREDRRGRAKPQRRRGARRACVNPRTTCGDAHRPPPPVPPHPPPPPPPTFPPHP